MISSAFTYLFTKCTHSGKKHACERIFQHISITLSFSLPLPPNICSQPATCLLSNAILMSAIYLLMISSECGHVKPNMHNRIVKDHFIRSDHSPSPTPLSFFLSVHVQMPSLRSFCLLKRYGVCLCVSVCVSEPSMPPYTHQSLFPRRHTTACARRVAEGWLRGWMEGIG